jgi:hypothetical protein
MNVEALLFGVVSFSAILLYYVTGNQSGWKQRSVLDFETSYWNAFQTFMWTLGAILFRSGPSPSILATTLVIPTALLYGLISEQPEMQFDLTGNKKLTGGQIAILTIVGVLMLFYIVIMLYNQDYTNPTAVLFKFIPLILFIIWIVTWLGIDKSAVTSSTTSGHVQGGYSPKWKQYIPGYSYTNTITTSYNLHFHHWIIGMIGFLLANDQSTMSQIVSGVFWGVFCQEAGAYGISIPSDSTTSGNNVITQDELGPGGTYMK